MSNAPPQPVPSKETPNPGAMLVACLESLLALITAHLLGRLLLRPLAHKLRQAVEELRQAGEATPPTAQSHAATASPSPTRTHLLCDTPYPQARETAAAPAHPRPARRENQAPRPRRGLPLGQRPRAHPPDRPTRSPTARPQESPWPGTLT